MPTDLFARAAMFASAGGLLRALGGRVGMVHVCVVVAAAAILWGGLVIVDGIRTRKNERKQSPQGLFFELCAAHQLDHSERRALWSAVETLPAADCCRVFLDPQILDRMREPGGADAAEYATLETKLFGPRA